MDLSGIITAANPNADQASKDKTKFGQSYDQFLTLLTTQLKNQDPLSPMDTAQFTNQLVQFSSVEQQIRGNDYLQKLLTLNTLSLTGIGLGYVGLNVYSPGSDFNFNGINVSDISYAMPAGATAGNITILDSAGNVVRTADADLKPGQHLFTWDGKDNDGNLMPAGNYTVKIGAQDAQQGALQVKTFTSGIVQGIETKEDGNVFAIINGKSVPITEIRQATMQGYTPANPT